MTGIAAQWCGTAPKSYRQTLEESWAAEGIGQPQWGLRYSIQNDLSPLASFIAANYNLPLDVGAFAEAARDLLDDVEKEIGWMYETLHTDRKTRGRIEYTVWSEVFNCPECTGEIEFVEEALDATTGQVRDTFPCPYCDVELNKNKLERVFQSDIDADTGDIWKHVTFRPSLIRYAVADRTFENKPGDEDLQLLQRINGLPFPSAIPTNPLPLANMYHGSRLGITTASTTVSLGIPGNSVDYVFTDPPFGENIYYADLNFLVESWHKVLTNAVPEAIADRFKKKGLPEYQQLMQRCFEEYRRVLKPGRWITVVFHNSKNAVWTAIQEAMLAAGFVVADVRTMDKQQGSYRQVTSTAVKQDLVISAYKPNSGLEERFELERGTEEGVWDFIPTHLRQLPISVVKGARIEVIIERQPHLLFDRMVAFHVLRNVTVPLSAGEFLAGLAQRFPERDGMVFLSDQVAEYDRRRMAVKEVAQLEIFVIDESSAIQWLRQRLGQKPQTFQEIHPQFLREIAGWQKHEKLPELSEMLEESFLSYDGNGDVPSQIHSYLSSNFKELRNLPKDDPGLRARARNRWYVADPRKASDLEKLRERILLREFDGYRDSAQRKLKLFRLEAMRAGFRRAWQDRNYQTIIAVAQ
jgi:hypothetical protein